MFAPKRFARAPLVRRGAQKQARQQAAPAPRPRIEGTVYAVGDVHGRLDLFERLLDKIRADAAALTSDEGPPTVILLGDLIDRGAVQVCRATRVG